MKPVRFIANGAFVTLHSAFISVSVCRFIPRSKGIAMHCFGCAQLSCGNRNGKFWAIYTDSKPLCQLDDIDEFVSKCIKEFYDHFEFCGEVEGGTLEEWEKICAL